jgi:hypothetical protein
MVDRELFKKDNKGEMTMSNDMSARRLAEGWFRAATPPGTEVRVELTPTSGGWMARAVATPTPPRVLPLLLISEHGLVQVCGSIR